MSKPSKFEITMKNEYTLIAVLPNVLTNNKYTQNYIKLFSSYSVSYQVIRVIPNIRYNMHVYEIAMKSITETMNIPEVNSSI